MCIRDRILIAGFLDNRESVNAERRDLPKGAIFVACAPPSFVENRLSRKPIPGGVSSSVFYGITVGLQRAKIPTQNDDHRIGRDCLV